MVPRTSAASPGTAPVSSSLRAFLLKRTGDSGHAESDFAELFLTPALNNTQVTTLSHKLCLWSQDREHCPSGHSTSPAFLSPRQEEEGYLLLTGDRWGAAVRFHEGINRVQQITRLACSLLNCNSYTGLMNLLADGGEKRAWSALSYGASQTDSISAAGCVPGLRFEPLHTTKHNISSNEELLGHSSIMGF